MLEAMITVMLCWNEVFSQQRTTIRAIRQVMLLICVIGRRTIARGWLLLGGEGDWSSEYKLLSRSQWDEQELYRPIFSEALGMVPGELIPIGLDDTRLKKTGKKIKTAHYGRDPLSPAFYINLQYGLRMLHSAILLPLYKKFEVSARALPVGFQEVPPIPKPGKKASEEEWKEYKKAKKKSNLPIEAVEVIKRLRKTLDELGARAKILVIVFDGSLCNKTIFKAIISRVILLGRMRKNAKLCYSAPKGGRAKYGRYKFTPEQVRTDGRRKWKTQKVFYGGKWRSVQYKEVRNVLWQRVVGTQKLRLIVIKPTVYRKTKNGRQYYRQPGYLITNDLEVAVGELIQIYLDRWQIEVAHKEMKDSFGVGQAQVRNIESVRRQPALLVAGYSLLHLVGLKVYGAKRSKKLGKLPPYQREKSRASITDLIKAFQQEVVNSKTNLPFKLNLNWESIVKAAI